MLFSNDQVAGFINRNFEATWQSVRPVPVVRIDFGDGHVMTRTLHGNIATYICRPSGEVIDVLPGLYEPQVYVDQLDQARLLAKYIDRSNETNALRHYHRRQADAIGKRGRPEVLRRISQGASITGQELGIKITMQPLRRLKSRSLSLQQRPTSQVSNNALADVNLRLLKEDTRLNETVRRRLVHEYLAEHGHLKPDAMTKWLYREVLKSDLDDPYLGLGEQLGVVES